MKEGNKATFWTGLLIVVMSLVYIFVTLGRVELVKWLAVIFGFYLTIFLFVEAGIGEYFRKKEYREIGFGDIMVWMTIIIAVLVFINTLLLIGTLSAYLPKWEWLISFTRMTGVTVGGVACLLGIIHVFSSRFK